MSKIGSISWLPTSCRALETPRWMRRPGTSTRRSKRDRWYRAERSYESVAAFDGTVCPRFDPAAASESAPPWGVSWWVGSEGRRARRRLAAAAPSGECALRERRRWREKRWRGARDREEKGKRRICEDNTEWEWRKRDEEGGEGDTERREDRFRSGEARSGSLERDREDAKQFESGRIVVSEGHMSEETKQTGLKRGVTRRRHQLIIRIQTRQTDQFQVVDQRAVLQPIGLV